MPLPRSELECTRDWRRYADTVAILAAIHDLFGRNPRIARYIGTETKLIKDSHQYKTPDLVAIYDNGTKGLIFEIKWSLPSSEDLLEKEIRELKKYTDTFINWRNATGHVDCQDLVLICHMDDVKRAVDVVKRISGESDFAFLNADGFAIWSWVINPPKGGERKEELRLFRVYGKTRNGDLETMLKEPGGILVSEDVLTFLRFNFFFVRQKPPIQYTMTTLIQHIFIASQPGIEKESYDVNTDWVYNRWKFFFPSWHEYDRETIQLKRKWLRESLDLFWQLKLIERIKHDRWRIPIPILRSRLPTQRAICKRIAKWYVDQSKKRLRGPVRITPIRGPKRRKGPLDQFLPHRSGGKTSC